MKNQKQPTSIDITIQIAEVSGVEVCVPDAEEIAAQEAHFDRMKRLVELAQQEAGTDTNLKLQADASAELNGRTEVVLADRRHVYELLKEVAFPRTYSLCLPTLEAYQAAMDQSIDLPTGPDFERALAMRLLPDALGLPPEQVVYSPVMAEIWHRLHTMLLTTHMPSILTPMHRWHQARQAA